MTYADLKARIAASLPGSLRSDESRQNIARILADADMATRKMLAEALMPNGRSGGVHHAGPSLEPEPEYDASEAPRDPHRQFPAPKTVGQILSAPEPDTLWLAEGLIPASGNLLIAGYPKSYKTFFHLELAVALATATPFLGKFDTHERRRVGVVLMEGSEREQARRVERLAMDRHMGRSDLDDWLYLWYRPPLVLSDAVACYDLGMWCQDLELDLCVVDAWSYVASGNSDRSDDVTPQLQNLSALRDRRPGICAGLVHHARKTQGDNKANRVTDLIRNSSAFGGWYDCGLYLHRKDELSPVRVRSELRDFPAPDEFAFTVEDQEPGCPSNSYSAQGWLRMRVSGSLPHVLEVEDAAKRCKEEVLAFVQDNPSSGGNKIRKGVPRDNRAINAALEMLKREGRVRHVPSLGRGKSEAYYATEGDGDPLEMEF